MLALNSRVPRTHFIHSSCPCPIFDINKAAVPLCVGFVPLFFTSYSIYIYIYIFFFVYESMYTQGGGYGKECKYSPCMYVCMSELPRSG